jgi:riboflavin kinase/FMN adenylyltransferase
MIKIIDLNDPSKEYPTAPCGLVLGNFDGVHRGHLALIERLKSLNEGREEPLSIGAFCFENHPFRYLGKPVSLLSSNEEKMELLRKAGLQFVIFGDFAKLKDLSPEEFVRDFLINRCDCRLAVCGFNYSFGAKGKGKAEDLRRLFEAEGKGTVSIVPPVTDGELPISSTLIREMLESGMKDDASRLLGRPFDRMDAINKEKNNII